ncbi:hypothetical protein GOP47_0006780 [Adiantum capillus-veneris]|uniref:Uncharacterized protein n=1 Tax=Adiantum capillus-veneris TaxID=13818 RepID=A0A9D4V3I6_ADICA|nr:hypothetical protein GOP47_0006780 [Adiantum capillus-veneris]
MLSDTQRTRAPSTMKQPMVPMPERPAQARFKSTNSGNSTRSNRDYEAQSPKWPPPASPKPAELIERYVALGMARDAASEKVIEDLQAALQRSLYPMQRMVSLEKTFRSSVTHIEDASQRLSVIEAKLNSKPNFAGVFAAGVAAGAFLQAAVKATPPVVAALNDLLGNIRKAFQR